MTINRISPIQTKSSSPGNAKPQKTNPRDRVNILQTGLSIEQQLNTGVESNKSHGFMSGSIKCYAECR